jgi:O-antigen ligase
VYLLGSTGIIGLACFIAFLGWHVVRLLQTLQRVRRERGLVPLETVLGLATVSVIGTWLRMGMQAVWNVPFPWLALALACGVRHYAEQELRQRAGSWHAGFAGPEETL